MKRGVPRCGIVPEERNTHMTTKGIIIGIAGPSASGKTTMAKQLAGPLHAHRAKYSDVLISIAKRRKLPVDKASLQALSNELRRMHGNDYLGQELWKSLQTISSANLIIEGNRLMDDMKFLSWIAKEEGKELVLIYIDADPASRWSWMNKRLHAEGKKAVLRAQFDILEQDPCEAELPQVREYIREHGTVIDTTYLSEEQVMTLVFALLSLPKAA